MSIEDKMANAKKSDWLSKSYTKSEFKARKQLAIISAKIQLKRIENGLSQQEFALLFGVTQGMISKWESGEYNFSVNTLTEICEKLKMEFTPLISDMDYSVADEYKAIPILFEHKKRIISFSSCMATEVIA
jgi:transcriptional regulator with XRE-family HTH domain